MINKITYGKNVYDRKEISAVNNVLKKSTQMGKAVRIFENIWVNGKFWIFSTYISI